MISLTKKLAPGEESAVYFFDRKVMLYRLQYKNKAKTGDVFTCKASNLESAHKMRDEWLVKIGASA